MNNTKNAPEIFFIMDDGHLDNFYLDFAGAEKRMLELVDKLCDSFIRWVEDGSYSIDEMQSELLDPCFCPMSIEVMDFVNGECYVDRFMDNSDISSRHSYYWQELESCVALVVQRQHEYKEAHNK